MQPRFIAKTHTEALRPGNYSLLIAQCTFPDQSAYPRQVERRLIELLGSNAKSVSKYTLLTATSKNRGFGFLRDTMIWSWKGYVINTVLKHAGKKESNNPMTFLELSEIERIMYLRFFLETDGALFLKLAERLSNKGEITYSYLKAEIQTIFKEIYEGYLDIAPDLRSRLKIKENYKETQKQLRDKTEGYDPGTVAHKVKPHLQALRDLRLLAVNNDSADEIYTSEIYNGVPSLSVLYEQVRDFAKLEDIISTDDYYALIAQVLNLEPIQYSPETHCESLSQALLGGYDVMRNTVSGMADIDALVDWARIKLLAEENVLVSRKDVERFFNEMRKANPSKVQYQVDGKGNIAYLILERK